ncbi:hypothetical protein ABZP36_008818 [Zizania latifolia]
MFPAIVCLNTSTPRTSEMSSSVPCYMLQAEFVRKTEGCHYLLIIIPSYAVAIVALCKLRDADRLLLVLRKMDDAGFAPWDFTYNSVVDVLVKEGRMEEALHLKDEMLAAGKKMGIVLATTLMHGYCL